MVSIYKEYELKNINKLVNNKLSKNLSSVILKYLIIDNTFCKFCKFCKYCKLPNNVSQLGFLYCHKCLTHLFPTIFLKKMPIKN